MNEIELCNQLIEKIKGEKYGEAHEILDELKENIPKIVYWESNNIRDEPIYFNTIDELVDFLKMVFKDGISEDELIEVYGTTFFTGDYKSVDELVRDIKANVKN